MFPCRLRTLDVTVPVNPVAAVLFSFLKDACMTRLVWLEAWADNGRTATITGTVKGVFGRTAAGGAISNETPNSRLGLPQSGLLGR